AQLRVSTGCLARTPSDSPGRPGTHLRCLGHLCHLSFRRDCGALSRRLTRSARTPSVPHPLPAWPAGTPVGDTAVVALRALTAGRPGVDGVADGGWIRRPSLCDLRRR